MKGSLFPLCLLFPFWLLAQPSAYEIKKYKIKRTEQKEDGKYGSSVRVWYYSIKGEDSLLINGTDTVMVKQSYSKGRLMRKTLSRVNSAETDNYDYSYSGTGSFKVTFTDGHFKMKSYEWFDAKGKTMRYQSPDGNTTTYKYDATGKLLSMHSDGHNQGTRIDNKYYYNSKGQLLKMERSFDERKSVVTYFYDYRGKLSKDSEKGQLDDDALENTSIYEYNEKGLLMKRTDKSIYPSNPKEEIITFEYVYSYEYY